MWDALIPRIADQFRIFALDTPGFGMSDLPPAQPTFDEYVDVFFESLDSLGIDQASLIGFHTGAGFATGMVIGYVIELRRRANRWKKRI